MTVKNQCLGRSIYVTLRSRKIIYDSLKKSVHTFTCFCRHKLRLRIVKSKFICNLLADGRNIGRRKVNLVDYRNNRKVLLKRHIHIANGLAFNTLTCINKKQSTFAGSNGARNFVRKIDVSRRIYKIKLVVISVLCVIRNGNSLTFYGNAAFALNVHIVKNLIFHFPLVNNIRFLNQAVRQS